jgi:hypothetical protein
LPSSANRVFDVRKATHPRNMEFLAVDRAPQLFEQVIRNRMWTPGTQLDQGREGHCVGFGAWGEALATPVAVRVSGDQNVHGHRMFHMAQELDEIAGSDYEGTTLTGGGNAMRRFRYLDQYLWLRSAKHVALAIGYSGPVVVGIPWYSGMDELDQPDEYFNVSGALRGWHCVYLYGVQGVTRSGTSNMWYPMRNSWGGASNGRLWASDLQEMLLRGADAWVGVGRHYSGLMGA